MPVGYDVVAADGAILYRLVARPVGMAGSDFPERIEAALRDEFESGDSPLTIERRTLAPRADSEGGA